MKHLHSVAPFILASLIQFTLWSFTAGAVESERTTVLCTGEFHPACYSLSQHPTQKSKYTEIAFIRKNVGEFQKRLSAIQSDAIAKEMRNIQSISDYKAFDGCPYPVSIELYDNRKLLNTKRFCTDLSRLKSLQRTLLL